MEERLLAARHAFAAGLPAPLRGAVEFYDFERYNSAATLQDNILFGRLVYGQAQGEQRIGTLISDVLNELGLHNSVIEVGLEYNVGVGGKRLHGDAAPEARHRPRADQAAATPDRQRGGGRRSTAARRTASATISWRRRRRTIAASSGSPTGRRRRSRSSRSSLCRAAGSPPRASRPTWRQKVGFTPS